MPQIISVREVQASVSAAAHDGRHVNEIIEEIISPAQIPPRCKRALIVYACSFASRYDLRRAAVHELLVVGDDPADGTVSG